MHHQGEWHAAGNDTCAFPGQAVPKRVQALLDYCLPRTMHAGRLSCLCDLSNIPFGTLALQNVVMTHLVTGRVRMLELLIPVIDRWSGRKNVQQQDSSAHLALGNHGEEAVYFHLRKKGCTVVARRWRSSRQPGDLDLVCWEGDTLCFVEVKTRSRFDVATAESAVDADKRRMIRRMARLYMSGLREQPKQVRFDIVSVYFNDEATAELRVIPNAFGWTEPAHRWN
jgi:putative endonuclease